MACWNRLNTNSITEEVRKSGKRKVQMVELKLLLKIVYNVSNTKELPKVYLKSHGQNAKIFFIELRLRNKENNFNNILDGLKRSDEIYK
jgi:hypothetical protein